MSPHHSYVSLCLISVLFLANDCCPWHCLLLHTRQRIQRGCITFLPRWLGLPLTQDAEGPRSRWKLWLLQGFSCLRCSPRKDDDFSGVFLSVWILPSCLFCLEAVCELDINTVRKSEYKTWEKGHSGHKEVFIMCVAWVKRVWLSDLTPVPRLMRRVVGRVHRNTYSKLY